MIYLGEQKEALEIYSKEAICFLNIKIKGRKSRNNPLGHQCTNSDCSICKNTYKNTIINTEFRAIFNSTLINRLVLSKPAELLEIHNEIESTYIPSNNLDKNKFSEQAKKLFITSGYENWFQKKDWNYKLAELLDKLTCTYCNREYIFIYKNNNKGRGMVPQFDHWFAKEKKPLLAISFYNLIPSCATCNSIKSNVKMNLDDHLHPYLDEDISNSYKFSYWFKKTHSPNIILKKNSLNGEKGKKTFEILNLPMIYKGHSSKDLKDLYDLRFKYSDNYLKTLLEKTFSSRLSIGDQEKYRLIFGIELEEENYHKRIMSKFKSDIITKLLSVK